MKKKDLQNELKLVGFIEDEHGVLWLGTESQLSVTVYGNLFGNVDRIGFFYDFKQELDEVFHDELWAKLINVVDGENRGFEIGSLGFECVEADIFDKNLLKRISGSQIREMCVEFFNCIKPLMDEYFL